MAHRFRRGCATALAALAAALLNWPYWHQVVAGLDASWQAGIADAFVHHMQWGAQVDFPYDLYGFAGFVQPLYRSTALIASAFVLAVCWALAALLVSGWRTWWDALAPPSWLGRSRAAALGVLSGAGFAWAVLALSWASGRAADFAGVTGLGLGFCALMGRPRQSRAALMALAVLAGFGALVKLETGAVLVGFLVLALAGRAPAEEEARWAALEPPAVCVATFALAWAAGGQSFGNLPGFARASLSLVSGYSSAMGGNLPGPAVAWWALAASAASAVALATALAGRRRPVLVAGALMVAGWGWAVVKDGFVSGDHYPGFFRALLVASALGWLWSSRRFLAGLAVVVAAVAALVAVGLPPVNPVASLRSVASELSQLASGRSFDLAVARARARVLEEEKVSPYLASLLRGSTVAVEPWDDMVAWALPGARWDPEPVLQSYSAYTAHLDALDASFLSSSRAPLYVLYRRAGFDRRDPTFDPPATMEALYCHYSQETVRGQWELLRRAGARCGRPEPAGTAVIPFGRKVPVPRVPGDMVTATFAFSAPLLPEVQGLLLKPPTTYITLWYARGRPVTYRFVPGTAGDAHVLSVPAALGYSRPFVPGRTKALAISGDGWRAGNGRVQVEFQARALRPLARPPGRRRPARGQQGPGRGGQ